MHGNNVLSYDEIIVCLYFGGDFFFLDGGWDTGRRWNHNYKLAPSCVWAVFQVYSKTPLQIKDGMHEDWNDGLWKRWRSELKIFFVLIKTSSEQNYSEYI